MKIQTSKIKIARTVIIISILVVGITLLQVGLTPTALLVDFVFLAIFGGVYYVVVGILPEIRLDAGSKLLVYRSDFGFTTSIRLPSITRADYSEGIGGFRNAVFISYKNNNTEKQLRIKSSLFDESDVLNLLKFLENEPSIRINSK